jgi:hypothetical protein
VEKLLEENAARPVRAYVVWEPMLTTDWARPTSGVLARIRDERAAQYWDPEHFVAKRLKAELDIHPDYPEPGCCEDDGVLWDMMAIFPAGVKWEESLPRPALLRGPVWKVAEARQVIERQFAVPNSNL